MMRKSQDLDHVVSRGSLRCGEISVEYYTTCPAPDQWTAIGVLFTQSEDMPLPSGSRLLVGNGACERSAIADLQNGFARSLAQAHRSCEIATEIIASPAEMMTGESPADSLTGQVFADAGRNQER